MAGQSNQTGLMGQADATDQAGDPGAQAGQGGSPKQRKLFETLLAGLLDWVWGKGRPDIQRQIQQATPDTLPTVIGHITYALIQQGVEQGERAGHDFDTDMLLGVATELIESLEKMAAALNQTFDAHAVSLQALTQTLNDYAESLPDGSDAQREAQQAMQTLSQGDMDQAAGTLQEIGQRNGVDPFATQDQQGQPSQGSQPAPQGLMGAAQQQGIA